MVDEALVRESLIEVEDPEMKISVIDLGLIYEVRIDDAHAEIDMTLTSPGCPVAPCLLYTSPSPRDRTRSRMPSSA